MAPKKPSIVLNIEQFIHDIQERPAIWNRNFHCNKAFLEQMWDELSSTHDLPKTVLKAKWKGLRDNFRVEYKRIPRDESGNFLINPETFESKWIHYYALLFLTDHMRHRLPKNEQEQSSSSSSLFQQQTDDCEKTIVEPDLTNGLIRCIQDSDEDFDEDEVDDDDEASLHCSPPAAHQTVRCTTIASVTGANMQNGESAAMRLLILKGLPPVCHLQLSPCNDDDIDGAEAVVQDLSVKSIAVNLSETNSTAVTTTMPPNDSCMTINSTTEASAIPGRLRANHSELHSQSHSHSHAKRRPVSPPPLYNKAHHPPPNTTYRRERTRDHDRDELMSISDAVSLTSSPELLNYTKSHCCASSALPHLRRRRARHSEDSNYNGSSIADSLTVSDDDDYYYLLSLHPYIKQLTPAQNLRTRTKIQKIIFKELYKEELEDGK